MSFRKISVTACGSRQQRQPSARIILPTQHLGQVLQGTGSFFRHCLKECNHYLESLISALQRNQGLQPHSAGTRVAGNQLFHQFAHRQSLLEAIGFHR